MRVWLVWSLALLAGCRGADAPARSDAGLRLLAQPEKSIVLLGQEPELSMRLVNDSPDRALLFVWPGVGSGSSWRTPRVYWTATLVGGDGTEHLIKASPRPHCAVGRKTGPPPDPTATLDPITGRTLGLDLIDYAFDLKQPGRWLLRGHYEYLGGAGDGGMGETPAFQLTSAPIEVEVAGPFELVAQVKGTVRAGERVPLSQFIQAELINHGVTAAPFHTGNWRARLKLLPAPAPPEPETREEFLARVERAPGARIGRDLLIASSDRLVVFGEGATVPQVDPLVTFPSAGKVSVVVELEDERRLKFQSPGIELVVE